MGCSITKKGMHMNSFQKKVVYNGYIKEIHNMNCIKYFEEYITKIGDRKALYNLVFERLISNKFNKKTARRKKCD